MVAVAAELARRGHRIAVLHVLVENDPAVRLYSGQGWRPWGRPLRHPLLHRTTQSYVIDLESRPAASHDPLSELEGD
jgi:hypothetical protein